MHKISFLQFFLSFFLKCGIFLYKKGDVTSANATSHNGKACAPRPYFFRKFHKKYFVFFEECYIFALCESTNFIN